ncbi:Sec-independent protein translocase subunit TatA/TatB [Taibaiella soli]|nr:twin-arginine translocase TatA/TatE family subunit [Taibaiella soli]
MALLTIHPQFLFSMPSGGEWLWVILAIIILFGGKKIPELARGLGKGIREFNDAKDGVKQEIEAGMKDKEKAQ